ncbi:MAG: outer membrane protein assembly factor BamA [Prevotellaceae bacterium]|jgi:outer membrane protein insertion porin family|nr:outer membrane protein assembly factor BamA [Prevotellaceae bacterium]
MRQTNQGGIARVIDRLKTINQRKLTIVRILLCTICGLALAIETHSQTNDSIPEFDFEKPPKTYIIEEITVSGISFADKNQIITISGLRKNDEIKVPGDEKFTNAVKRIWANNHFGSVSVDSVRTEGDKIWLDIKLTERPRIYTWDIVGVKKGQIKDLKEKVNIRRGAPLSDYTIKTSVDKIKHFYAEKGFLNAEVEVEKSLDTTITNAIHLLFRITKNNKVKIKEIKIDGNSDVKAWKLRGAMKKTKQKGFAFKSIFKSRKYIESNYDEDRENLIAFYNRKGYRDAEIVEDSVYRISKNRVGIKMKIYEGRRYYFRNITWVGNTKFPTDQLEAMLRIKKGDVYDRGTLDERLNYDEQSVSSYFYQDNGYIFAHLMPVETNITGDSIDLEIRIHEGEQAAYSRINIAGNTKTNEHVIRRELRTVPGDLFSITKYKESIRMLSAMGHFDPEELQKNAQKFIKPNAADGTVDLNYEVTEKSNDQLELSGGWGANMFVGSVGVKFSNFSMRRFFDFKSWRPVPTGDGQTLGLRFQTNGTRYQQFSINFMEPWLGGRKPISLSISAYFSNQNSAYNPYYSNYYGGGYPYYYNDYSSNESMKVMGFSAGLGHRLQWPDNWFSLYYELSLQRYQLRNWTGGFIFSNGNSNNFSLKIMFGRKSTNNPIFPSSGSDLSVGVQLTPPYSLFSPNKNWKEMKSEEKYKWIEYNKWSFNGSFFTPVIGKFVLMARAQFGYLGYYNKNWGYSPFEGFVVGGDGMSGYVMYGQDIVGLRGYENNSLTPYRNNAYEGNVYDKFTLELRYPIIMQPQSQIYALSFFEAGNCWETIKKFNPFDTKRSAGIGVRIYLPIVGMLGIDWGYGFDKISNRSGANGSNFHFVIGQSF